MVVEPFSFAQNAFLYESEAFGDGAAFDVADGAMQNDAITVLFAESVIREASSGAGYDSAALMRRTQPVSQFGSSI
jgi:hypothetical protein